MRASLLPREYSIPEPANGASETRRQIRSVGSSREKSVAAISQQHGTQHGDEATHGPSDHHGCR